MKQKPRKTKKKGDGLTTPRPCVNMKYAELAKTELCPETTFDPWSSYHDEMKRTRGKTKVRDKTLIRPEQKYISTFKPDAIKKHNIKNKRLIKRRNIRKLKIELKNNTNINIDSIQETQEKYYNLSNKIIDLKVLNREELLALTNMFFQTVFDFNDDEYAKILYSKLAKKIGELDEHK